MPAITYSDWSGGLDLRLPLGTQDANKLYRLQNAYITAGKKIKKRPALKLISTELSNSVGLQSLNGGLVVFIQTGTTYTAPSGVGVFSLDGYTLGGTTALVDVRFAKMFQGYPYVVAVHNTLAARVPRPPGQATPGGLVLRDIVRHHYLDGASPTYITDANCPHGESVTSAASRIFATGGEVVRYCAAGDARDWTTASDAGFLPTSLQQNTSSECTAVGTFEDALCVFFADGSQVWTVVEDPTANQIQRRLYGVGTTHAQSLASFYRDLVFASPFGVRSITVQEAVQRLDESDVGVPVDSLVVPVQKAHELTSSSLVRGVWIQQFGQYWILYDAGGYTRAFVYSFSKSSKLACWSDYTFPVLLTGIASVAGKVYARTASSLYELDADTFTDEGSGIAVDVQMSFQDAKLPGVEKMFYGADYVITGTADVSFLFDPRDTTKETNAQSISGDTRAGGLVGVEVTAPSIAPRFQHNADEAFELDMLSLYFHPLSAQAGGG